MARRPTPYLELPGLYRVAIGGKGPYMCAANKFAYNGAVGTTAEDIWTAGGVKSYLSSAETVDVVSSDANDTSDGTGARTVQIYGLDGNYEMLDETIILNGTTPVTSSNSYLRLYRAVVRSAGSGGVNAGDITVDASTSSSTCALVSTGDCQTLQSQYTVPANHYALIGHIEVTTARNEQLQLDLQVREEDQVFAVKRRYSIYGAAANFTYEIPLVVPPKADIRVQGTNLGASTITASCAYDYILINQNEIKLPVNLLYS